MNNYYFKQLTENQLERIINVLNDDGDCKDIVEELERWRDNKCNTCGEEIGVDLRRYCFDC